MSSFELLVLVNYLFSFRNVHYQQREASVKCPQGSGSAISFGEFLQEKPENSFTCMLLSYKAVKKYNLIHFLEDMGRLSFLGHIFSDAVTICVRPAKIPVLQINVLQNFFKHYVVELLWLNIQPVG